MDRILETDRLIIRNLNENDFEDFYELFASPFVRPRLSAAHPITDKEEAKELLEKVMHQPFYKAIVLKSNNKMIGHIRVGYRDEKYLPNKEKILNLNREGLIRTISYSINPDYWNNGYATEALNRVLQYLYLDEKIELVIMGFFSKNIASLKVLKKCGFKFLRREKNVVTWLETDEMCKHVDMILTRNKWLERNKDIISNKT